MRLMREAATFTTWTHQVLKVCYAIRPWTTTGVIAATAAAGVTKVLAFCLPLKVILLAASDGVPRYFPFIGPARIVGWRTSSTPRANHALDVLEQALYER